LNRVFLESDQSDYVTDFKTHVCLQAEMKAKGRTALPAPREHLEVVLFCFFLRWQCWNNSWRTPMASFLQWNSRNCED